MPKYLVELRVELQVYADSAEQAERLVAQNTNQFRTVADVYAPYVVKVRAMRTLGEPLSVDAVDPADGIVTGCPRASKD